MPKSSRLVLSDHALQLIAGRFRILGEPSRLKLIHALQNGERSVSDLVQASGLTQANVSRHLNTLAHAGMLSRRKQGLQVFYSVADPEIFKLCDHVCGSLQRRLALETEALG
jgi:ArsR family transcriptional regulator